MMAKTDRINRQRVGDRWRIRYYYTRRIIIIIIVTSSMISAATRQRDADNEQTV